MSVREKTQADFDLEKLFEMLDEALTSKDERVQNALRGLLTVITLTRTQDDGQMAIETRHGPLRQMQEDLRDISRSLNNLREEVRDIKHPPYQPPQPYAPNPGVGSPWPTPGTPQPWGINPNMPYTTSKTSSSSTYIPPGPFIGSNELTANEKDSIMKQIDTINKANKSKKIKLTK